MAKRNEETNGPESIAIEDMTPEQLFAERTRLDNAIMFAQPNENWQHRQMTRVEKRIRELTL